MNKKKSLFSWVLIAGVLCASSTPAFAKCIVGGCSGQLCIPAEKDIVTTCEWLDEYGCYQIYGECIEQRDGQCDWKQTPALQSCLKDPSIASVELEKKNKARQEKYYQEHKGENCVKTGSYSQVCIDALDMGGKNNPDFDAVPNLAWQDGFLCYSQYAECKKTSQDICGWVDSGQLKDCLANPKLLLKPTPVTNYQESK